MLLAEQQQQKRNRKNKFPAAQVTFHLYMKCITDSHKILIMHSHSQIKTYEVF